MAAMSRDWALFFTFSGIFATIIFYDVKLVFFYALRLLAAVGVFTLIYHFMAPFRNKVSTWWYRSKKPASQGCGLSASEIEDRRSGARQRIQQRHSEKADSYSERVLRPREEARARRQEAEYRRLTGHSIPWSGRGRQLAQGSAVTSTPGGYGNAETAAISRRLPGNIEKQENLPTTIEKKSSKKKVSLPDEPPEGGSDVITVILRTPQGRSFRRRVLQTDSVQLLLDYMTSIGYHHKLYSLALTYPRRVISRDPVVALRDVGIDRDSAINIEEKDENEEEDTPGDI